MIHFTHHATMRYQRRIPAPRPDLGEVAVRGRVQYSRPGGMDVVEVADAYLIFGVAIFPLAARQNGDWVAKTCIRRRRLPKAERRARREAARDERWAA
jgi:hypothetical protein